jgi:hypothetical protein
VELDNKVTKLDDRMSGVLEMIAQGKKKNEIIKEHRFRSWQTLEKHFFDRGYIWDGVTFVPKQEDSAVEDAALLNTKAGLIIRSLNQKDVDARQVARKNGFQTTEQMGDYMRGQGFVWCADTSNYEYNKQKTDTETTKAPVSDRIVQENIPSSLDGYKEVLDYLVQNQSRLRDLLEITSDGTIPRYKFKGVKANKTINMTTSIQTLLTDFSKEFNVSQKDVVEVALAEFFKRYGYENQLNSAIQV